MIEPHDLCGRACDRIVRPARPSPSVCETSAGRRTNVLSPDTLSRRVRVAHLPAISYSWQGWLGVADGSLRQSMSL